MNDNEARRELPSGLFWRKGSRWIWMKFMKDGALRRRSTRTINVREAQKIQAAYLTRINRAAAGLERDPSRERTLEQFQKKFLQQIRVDCSEHPQTIDFYERRFREILQYPGFEDITLDEIDEPLIDEFAAWKLRQKSKRGRPYSIASVNRCLATLKRCLRMAYRLHLLNRVPLFSLKPGEKKRNAVLRREREQEWLDAAPEPLRTFGILSMDLGLRLAEFQNIAKQNSIFRSDIRYPLGYLEIRGRELDDWEEEGVVPLKSEESRREVPLTRRARAILEAACKKAQGELLFPISKSTLEHQNRRVRNQLKLRPDFVLHSFRHTYGTRLGEAGASAHEIKQLMGHATLSISQQYVHKLTHQISKVVAKMEAANQSAQRKSSGRQSGKVVVAAMPRPTLGTILGTGSKTTGL